MGGRSYLACELRSASVYTVPLDAASRPDQGVVTEDGSGMQAGPGVAFPEVDARRSTTATGRAILADAAAAVDRDLEGRIRAAGSWRADYLGVLRELTIASAERTSSLAIARAGTCLDAHVTWGSSATGAR